MKERNSVLYKYVSEEHDFILVDRWECILSENERKDQKVLVIHLGLMDSNNNKYNYAPH